MAWPSSPDIADVRYAANLQTRLDVFRNASGTDDGGNVALVFVHGGGWNGGLKTQIQTPGQHGYDLADYVLSSGLTTKRWNLITVDYRTFAYTAPLKMSYQADVFEGIEDVACAVQFIKDNARLYGTDPGADSRSFGVNPSKIIVFGVSAGGLDGLVVSLSRSRPYRAGLPGAQRRFEYRSSSVPALVINFLGVIDVRFDEAEGVETFPYDKFPALFGTSSTDGGAEWGAVPPDWKAACSPLAILEQDTLEARPAGIYSIYQTTTATGKPYANIHAAEQAPILDAAMAAQGIDHVTEVIVPNSWADYSPTPATSPSYALSGRVVAFCEARLAS